MWREVVSATDLARNSGFGTELVRNYFGAVRASCAMCPVCDFSTILCWISLAMTIASWSMDKAPIGSCFVSV